MNSGILLTNMKGNPPNIDYECFVMAKCDVCYMQFRIRKQFRVTATSVFRSWEAYHQCKGEPSFIDGRVI